MAAPDRRPSIQENFDRSHATHTRSAILQRIWRDAYGDEYPAEASPNGFIPRSILRRLADELRVGPGETLVDLGCGHGGPGLWVAQQSGANLVGIDLSPVGVALARERASALGVDARTAFRVGDVCATGLPDGGFDAAMSLDVLTFVPDKEIAVREVARLLRPGGRFCCTTWERTADSGRLTATAAPVADYRPLLEAGGFAIATYEEVPDWRVHQRALLEGIVATEAEIVAEVGAAEGGRWMGFARGMLDGPPAKRYVFIAAERSH